MSDAPSKEQRPIASKKQVMVTFSGRRVLAGIAATTAVASVGTLTSS
jgi:hypothetical protein